MKSTNLHYQTLLYKNNGQIWSFYTLGNSLFYTINTKNNLSKKIKLIDNVKDYDISMDTKETIHLVCVKEDGELCYLKYSSNSWKKKTFKKPNSKSIISHINVLNINDSTHIFYAYKNTTSNNPHKIFHLYSHRSQWKYIFLSPVLISMKAKPYHVDYNENGDIVFLYRNRELDKSKFFIKVFNTKSCTWSSPMEITFNPPNGIIKNFLIDANSNLHFLYKSAKGISYFNCDTKKLSNLKSSIQSKKFLDLNSSINSQYQLFELDDTLWISWKSEDSLSYCTSKDLGKSWNDREEFEEENTLGVKFIGSEYNDLELKKPIFTICISRDTETYFLGMDIDFLTHEDIHENIYENLEEEDFTQLEDTPSDNEYNEIIETLDDESARDEEEPTCSFEDDLVDDENNELNDIEANFDEDMVLAPDVGINDIPEDPKRTMFDEAMEHCSSEGDESFQEEWAEDEINKNVPFTQEKVESKIKKSFIDKLKDFLTSN